MVRNFQFSCWFSKSHECWIASWSIFYTILGEKMQGITSVWSWLHLGWSLLTWDINGTPLTSGDHVHHVWREEAYAALNRSLASSTSGKGWWTCLSHQELDEQHGCSVYVMNAISRCWKVARPEAIGGSALEALHYTHYTPIIPIFWWMFTSRFCWLVSFLGTSNQEIVPPYLIVHDSRHTKHHKSVYCTWGRGPCTILILCFDKHDQALKHRGWPPDPSHNLSGHLERKMFI